MMIVISLSAPPVLAEVPDMPCPEPALPAKKPETAKENAAFSKIIAAYHSCITIYADARKRDAKAHGDAANNAVKAWNAFVKKTRQIQSE